jgi:hypothetical protein
MIHFIFREFRYYYAIFKGYLFFSSIMIISFDIPYLDTKLVSTFFIDFIKLFLPFLYLFMQVAKNFIFSIGPK